MDLRLGDCLEVIKNIPDKSIDLVVTDPPYEFDGTGGGGALAMAIALLGMVNCATVSMPGHIKTEAEIKAEVDAGKKAYGFTAQHAEEVIPIILKYIL